MRQKQNVRFECRLRVCVQSPWWQSHWYWRGYAEGVGFLPWSEDWWWLRNKSWSVSRCHQETEWDLLHVSDVTGKSEDRKCDSMIFYLQVEANIALAKDEILLSYWGDIGSPLPLHPLPPCDAGAPGYRQWLLLWFMPIVTGTNERKFMIYFMSTC